MIFLGSPLVGFLFQDWESALTHMVRPIGVPNYIMTPPRLPPEIVLRILDLANAPSPDPKLLQSCSLVSNAWSAHAQKMLFRSVSISTRRGYTALVAAFRPQAPHRNDSSVIMRGLHTTKSPQIPFIAGMPSLLPTAGSNILRGSVIELNVIIDFNQQDGLTFVEISHVISLCPNLRMVGISVFGTQPPGEDVGAVNQSWMGRLAPPMPDEVLEELRTAPNASRISELRLNDWSDNPHVLIQLLGIWSHITSLKIAGKLPIINNDTGPPLPIIPLDSVPCALESLSLNCATNVESSVDFVKWLLAGSHQTLRRLEFLKEPSGKLLEDIFNLSAFPFESVYLPSCLSPTVGQIIRHRLGSTSVPVDGDNETDGNHALVRAQGLKELFVEDPSTPLNFLMSAVRSETLQSVGFGVDESTDLSCIARAIKVQTGLKRVVVWIRDGGRRDLRLGSLRIACAIKGIELEETRERKEFRARSA